MPRRKDVGRIPMVTPPTHAISDEVVYIKRRENANQDMAKTDYAHKELVNGMETLEDLRIVLAQMVTEATCPS